MMLGKVVNYPRVFEQAGNVSCREDEIEMVGTIVLLDLFKLAFKLGGFLCHQINLLGG